VLGIKSESLALVLGGPTEEIEKIVSTVAAAEIFGYPAYAADQLGIHGMWKLCCRKALSLTLECVGHALFSQIAGATHCLPT